MDDKLKRDATILACAALGMLLVLAARRKGDPVGVVKTASASSAAVVAAAELSGRVADALGVSSANQSRRGLLAFATGALLTAATGLHTRESK